MDSESVPRGVFVLPNEVCNVPNHMDRHSLMAEYM